MFDLMRDAPLGQALNYLSKGRLLPYPEERSGYVVPEKYRLHPTEVVGNGASDPTLVGSRSQSRSKNRNSLAPSIPASTYSGYPPTADTYNSRIVAEKASNGEKRGGRQFRETDLEEATESGNENPERQRSSSREGSIGGRSTDTQTREKHEREHWTKKMLKDPQVAKREGLEDDYEYLVKWDGPDDPDNPQSVYLSQLIVLSYISRSSLADTTFRSRSQEFQSGKEAFHLISSLPDDVRRLPWSIFDHCVRDGIAGGVRNQSNSLCLVALALHSRLVSRSPFIFSCTQDSS